MECLERSVWWTGQRFNDVFDLDERAWPSMYEEQRDGARALRSMMYEMQRYRYLVLRLEPGVHDRGELLKLLVQLGFDLPPVILLLPILLDLLCGTAWRTIGEGFLVFQFSVDKSCQRHLELRLLEELLVNRDSEWGYILGEGGLE